MRMTNKMPTSGQFVVIWKRKDDGTMWSDTHKYCDGELITYSHETDEWDYSPTFLDIKEGLIEDIKFMVNEK